MIGVGRPNRKILKQSGVYIYGRPKTEEPSGVGKWICSSVEKTGAVSETQVLYAWQRDFAGSTGCWIEDLDWEELGSMCARGIVLLERMIYESPKDQSVPMVLMPVLD